MADNKVFHNPSKLGKFDLGTSQKSKAIVFDTSQDVIDACKVVITSGRKVVKTYTDNNGLARSNANRTVTLSLNGADYTDYLKADLVGHCSFFVAGDTEITFELDIIETYV